MTELKEPARPTNEEFVGYMMSYSKFGGLTQIFIIEAIRYYAEQIASQPAPTESGTSLINPIAWHAVAVDILEKMKEQYEPTAKG